MNTVTRLLAAATVVMTIFAGTVAAEEIKVSAGGAPHDDVVKPVIAPFETATGDKITLTMRGANESFKSLDRGEADVAVIGSTLDDMFAIMKKEGYGIKDPSLFKSDVVAKTQLVVAVNQNNPVASLTREQIKAIYTGKIQNWKELGGNDKPIMVIVTTQNPATSNAFRKMVMDNDEYLADNVDLSAFDEIANAIATNPGAIGYGSTATIGGEGSRIPKMPEFIRPVAAMTKGAPSPKVKRLIDFIKGEGKQYIKN